MSATRLIARPMLSSMFIFGGIDAVRNPDGKVPKAEKVTGPLTDMVPSLPKDTATLVRINGAVQIGAGVALATGKFRRLAAVALIGSTVPTTLAGHRFWEEEDPEQRAQQQVHFLKNIGLLGGLILAAVDTEGAPSLTWRAKRGAKRTSQAVSLGLESSTALVAKGRGRAARKANKAAAKAAKKATKRARKAADRALARASQVDLKKARKRAAKLAKKAAARAEGIDLAQARLQAKKTALRGAKAAEPWLHASADRASELAGRASEVADKATERAGDLWSKASERLPVG